ncbi:MAG TPA: MFS transporter, partial [Intrasporangiaceae bacterium]|nr:MFS transporter [Intrasporangiaceae bacterium]
MRERLQAAAADHGALTDLPVPDDDRVGDDDLWRLFEAQLLARHVDLYARELQAQGEGFYTIGSMGHESNAAVALASRATDPALLHYRSGGFYCARAVQAGLAAPERDILLSVMCSVDDPISGGRHKVFGHKELAVIPQTSTIASHLPRAVGLAFAHERAHARNLPDEWPADAIVVASIGDASLNHSTASGALNAAEHAVYQGIPIPLLLVVEDNGIGISVRTPAGWVARRLGQLSGFEVFTADGADPVGVLATARAAVAHVRGTRRPAVLHLRTVRLGAHAGSDAEVAYRSRRDIEADYARDPLLATAQVLVQRGLVTAEELLERYARVADAIAGTAAQLQPVRRLAGPDQVAEPLVRRDPAGVVTAASGVAADRVGVFRGRLPEDAGGLTLAQSVNATLTDLMAADAGVLVLGEDVGVKGGVYGVTRELRRAFGAARVFDTLLDEQAILGTALGAALAGFLPVPEIQYLAYLHNAIDQLRGEAATLAFFSNGQYRNGMVVRIPGLAYQKGFGGHFHNDNSVAALLDIPGVV